MTSAIHPQIQAVVDAVGELSREERIRIDHEFDALANRLANQITESRRDSIAAIERLAPAAVALATATATAVDADLTALESAVDEFENQGGGINGTVDNFFLERREVSRRAAIAAAPKPKRGTAKSKHKPAERKT